MKLFQSPNYKETDVQPGKLQPYFLKEVICTNGEQIKRNYHYKGARRNEEKKIPGLSPTDFVFHVILLIRDN